MIDFHTHILPGIDDGSRDIGMTEKMLQAELSQGVSHIYATPHFYAHRRSVQQFLERREGALAQLRELQEKRPDLPQVTTGAEVYYFSGIGKAEHISDLSIEGTDILLLEMPFGQWSSDMVQNVRQLIRNRHLRIVLAHVERYYSLQDDRRAWDEIINMPLTLQMNSGSFTAGITSGIRRMRTAKWCIRMLEENDNCIIGTDCHNLTDRAPDLAEARKTIEHKLGVDRLASLDEYTEELLKQ